MNRLGLRNLILAQREAEPRLPLVHNTDVFSFREIVEAGQIAGKPCDVFAGERLIYFFAGRPSYRVNPNEQATSLSHFLPVCLLFRNHAVHPVKRIYPFDTGAFQKNHYADAIHSSMHLDAFSLEPDPSTPGRLISLFFGSVRNYLEARPIDVLSIDPAELETYSYHALISQKLSNNRDNRISGVELQFEGELSLSGALEAVVLPDAFASSSSIMSALTESNITPIYYRQLGRTRPSEYVTTLFELCLDYYRRIGILPS